MAKDHINLQLPIDYVQISEADYLALGERSPEEVSHSKISETVEGLVRDQMKEVKIYHPAEPTEDEDILVVEDVAHEIPQDVDEGDLVSNLIAGLDKDEEQEDAPEAPKVQLNESVLEGEEKAQSNEFERISTLREEADKTKQAKVTKGKAHGIYEYQDDSWVRIGDL